jgi:hypothetical protein
MLNARESRIGAPGWTRGIDQPVIEERIDHVPEHTLQAPP